MTTMKDRIRKARLNAGIATGTEAARQLGIPASTYLGYENGDREPGKDAARRLAKAYKVSLDWLLTGEGSLSDSAPPSNEVAVMGRIGAGQEISPEEEQIPPEGLYEIEVPFPVPADAVAFEVSGESMWPRYDDGDVVICWRTEVNPEELVGWEAAVRTADGRRLLKRVVRGSEPQTYDLESHNAPPIRGVRLEWIAGVHGVVRSGQWRKLSSAGRRRMIKKMTATK